MGTVKCYCLKDKKRGLHCPLTTDARDLERTFNFFVRDEEIVQVDIDDSFVCEEMPRRAMCGGCPFN